MFFFPLPLCVCACGKSFPISLLFAVDVMKFVELLEEPPKNGEPRKTIKAYLVRR